MTAERKVTAVIADDEPVARAGLRAMLAEVGWVTCIGEAANGPAAVEAINRLQPDLAFLDIEMPGLRGTDVARVVQHQSFVIFTTAWAQHAATAFELGALDYILKPFGIDRLTRTLDRVRSVLGESDPVPSLDRFRDAFHAGPIGRLFVRSGRALIPIAVESVSWFEADGDYVAIHVDRSRHLMHVSLAKLELRLDPARFVRVHRTSIVNMDRVKAFQRVAGGQMVAELDDGTRVEVSRARAKELRALGT